MKVNNLLLMLILVIFAWHSQVAFAKTPYIQDYAKVVSADKAQQLESLLAKLETQYGVLVEEVILPHYAGKSEEVIVHAFLQQLKQDSPTIEKKILLLIVLENNQVALYHTANLANQFPNKVKDQITRAVSAKLKDKKYDEMATVGLIKIEKIVSVKPQSRQKMILNILVFLIALGAVVGMIKYRK